MWHPRGARNFVGLWFLLAALSVSCSKKRVDPTPEPPPEQSFLQAGEKREVRVIAAEHGFTPSSVSIRKGPPGSTTPVTFVRTTDKTCATEVVFPELDVKKDLPLDTPVVVDVPADAERRLTFQCGMGMYKGALVVK